MRRFAELAVKKGPQQSDKNNEPGDDQPLGSRCPLDIVFATDIADLAGTVSCPAPEDQGIELASQTDAKGGFEEQENQTDKTRDARDGAVGVDQDQKHEHRGGKHHANDPGKFFLRGANVFGHLPADDQPSDDQRRREPRVYKNPDDKIQEKYRDDIFYRHKIAGCKDDVQRNERRQEQDTCRRPDLPLIQHGDGVTYHLFPELYIISHVV